MTDREKIRRHAAYLVSVYGDRDAPVAAACLRLLDEVERAERKLAVARGEIDRARKEQARAERERDEALRMREDAGLA